MDQHVSAIRRAGHYSTSMVIDGTLAVADGYASPLP